MSPPSSEAKGAFTHGIWKGKYMCFASCCWLRLTRRPTSTLHSVPFIRRSVWASAAPGYITASKRTKRKVFVCCWAQIWHLPSLLLLLRSAHAHLATGAHRVCLQTCSVKAGIGCCSHPCSSMHTADNCSETFSFSYSSYCRDVCDCIRKEKSVVLPRMTDKQLLGRCPQHKNHSPVFLSLQAGIDSNGNSLFWLHRA